MDIRFNRIMTAALSAIAVIAFTLIINNGSVYGADAVKYMEWDENSKSLKETSRTDCTVIENQTITELKEGWYFLKGTNTGDTIVIDGDVHLILANRSRLEANHIRVDQPSKLSTYEQPAQQGINPGCLDIDPVSDGEAGIGSSRDNATEISIFGGEITVRSNIDATCIGGGAGGYAKVSIYGGNISTSCLKDYGVGIGSSGDSTIKIYGGDVTNIMLSMYGAGIGFSSDDDSEWKACKSDVMISGGNITELIYGINVGIGSYGYCDSAVNITGGNISGEVESMGIGIGNIGGSANVVISGGNTDIKVKPEDNGWGEEYCGVGIGGTAATTLTIDWHDPKASLFSNKYFFSDADYSGYEFKIESIILKKNSIVNDSTVVQAGELDISVLAGNTIKPEVHKVVFMKDTETILKEVDCVWGDTVEEPSLEVPEGYGLGGWYTNSSLSGEPYDFSTHIESDHTLYPKVCSLISGAAFNGSTEYVFTGKEIIPKFRLTYMMPKYEALLIEGEDYTCSYDDNINAGTGVIIIKGMGNYTGEYDIPFTIGKAANNLSVKGKIATVGFAKLKKKAQRVKVSKAFKIVTKGEGKITYSRAKGNRKIVIAKNGAITVKKGLKKGSYKITASVKAVGDDNHKSINRTVKFCIKVI